MLLVLIALSRCHQTAEITAFDTFTVRFGKNIPASPSHDLGRIDAVARRTFFLVPSLAWQDQLLYSL